MTIEPGTAIGATAMKFADLFNRGLFNVPWHQRYYDWKPNDVRALLDDIDEAINENRACYFLGAIILVQLESRRWEINDGQQRMLTLSLMCAALCRRFVNEAKGSQREALALRMLFDLDANSTCTMDEAELYTPRISPSQNDWTRYRLMIRGHTIGTNGTLTAAWAEIEEFFSPMGLERLERYFDFLIGKLEVACIEVPPQIDPNAVFETINCRGKQLDDLDLIRNYIYSHFNSAHDSERKSSVHENLELIRTIIPNADNAAEYMRCHLQCKFGFLRKDHFYRDVRQAIRKRTARDGKPADPAKLTDYIFELTRQVTAKESLELFRKITAPNPDPEFIRAFQIASRTTNSPRSLQVFLRELRRYKVTQPLVFAMLSWYLAESDVPKKRRSARVVNRNLKRLAAFVLRTAFVAPKFETSHFEVQFSGHARIIADAGDIHDDEFMRFLLECDRTEYGVLDDEKFQNELLEKNITTKAKAKEFLSGINRAIQRDAHWGGWTAFDHESANDWVHRLGNLTLMGPADNKPGPKYNGDFAKKCEIYKDSGVALTRKVAEFESWNPAAIDERQRTMAKLAVGVWEFD